MPDICQNKKKKTYFAPNFNKTVAPGASTHHCKTKMEQKANDREL